MAEIKVKFLATKTGKVHVVTTKARDAKESACSVVKQGHTKGQWKGKRSLSPDAALALDDCIKCHSHNVAHREKHAQKPPAQKRAEATAKRDESMAKASGKQTWYAAASGRGWTTNPEFALKDDEGNPVQSMLSRTKPKQKVRPITKVKKPGTRKQRRSGSSLTARTSQGTAEGSEAKAKELAAFGDQAGWSCDINHLGTTEYEVVAKRGDEIIHCYFVDGKYNRDRFSTVSVGTWSGRLRGVHGVRKQMANEGRDRPFPRPGQGRSALAKARRDDADDPDAERENEEADHLPFTHDAPDVEIIDAIAGRVIRWRNVTSGKTEHAEVPSKKARIMIADHPKRDTRIVSFNQVVYDDNKRAGYGSERIVALDRMLRVL